MAYLTPGDFTNSVLRNPRGGLRALNQQAHLGGFAGSRSMAIYAMAAQQQASAAAAEANKAAITQIQSARSGMEADLVRIQRLATAARDQSFAIQDMASNVDHPSAMSLSQEAQDAAYDIDTLSQGARKAFDDFDYEERAKKAAGGNYAVSLLAVAEQTAGTIKSAGSRISRASSAMAASVGRLQSLQKKSADAAALAQQQQAQQQADADAAAQHRRDLEDSERARIQQDSDERRARDQQAAQDERDFQQAQVEEQRRISDLERQYDASERARIAEIEQRRMDAEMRREQQAIAAEDRRLRLREAAGLRVEEAALRREEREAQLQQLMMIQELAAQGLPAGLLPPGLPAPQPQQQPGLAPRPGGMFTLPGFAPPQTTPSAIPAGAWSPYGQVVQGPGGAAPTGFPVQVPGVQFAPQGLPQGYAAQPAPAAYQQSSGFPQMQQPQPQQTPGEAPPGFAWGGFDPGTEMFGLGELHETLNPSLQGGLIEERWTMEGPQSDGNYTLTRPNGQLFQRYTEDQVYAGTIRDETGNVVWVSPQKRPDSGAAAVTADIASVLRAAIQATGSVMTAKEQRKAQKYSARTGGFPAASIPGSGYDPGRPPERTNALTVVAGVALAAGALWGVSTLIKKKGKAKK